MVSNIASYIDHTLLKPEAGKASIIKLCQEASNYKFAAVCINPAYVKLARRELDKLKCSKIKVCTVIGFPLGASATSVKVFETETAITAGAEEIDMVINIGILKEGDQDFISTEIKSVIKAAQGKMVKVILETSLLTEEEKILGCRLAKEAGADFVKTSTGFSLGGATVSDIRLMRDTVGLEMGIKASGGISSREELLKMLAAGATRIGTSRGVEIMKE